MERLCSAKEADSRIRHTSEIIEGIVSVKSFGWEKPFMDLIGSFRSKEAQYINRSQILRGIFQGIYFCGSAVNNFATFSVIWATGQTITIPLVFSTLTMLAVLRNSVNRQWTRAMEIGSETIASCNRIDNFLCLPDNRRQLDSLLTSAETNPSAGTPSVTLPPEVLVRISDADFCYGDRSAPPVLSDINIEVRPGELVMVIGKVGSGKSSLLSAILGELTLVRSPEGEAARAIAPATRIAYCAQRPWILASSVRENITFAGSEDEDEALYRLAVESCSIVQDMLQWPSYDDTEIGERGVSISGGQKARIALARAVYSDAPLCVLDDPLSAVDAMVSRSLFFDCIVGALRNRGKGVVLATHQLQYLKYADRIVVLDKHGKQIFNGSFPELQSKPFYQPLTNKTSSKSVSDTVNSSPSDFVERQESVLSRVDSNLEESIKNDMSTSTSMKDAPKYDPSRRISSGEESNEQAMRRIIIQEEDKAEGLTEMLLYWKYFKAGGLCFSLFLLSLMAVSQGELMICEYFVRWWATSTFGPQSDSRYLWIFAILTIGCIVFGFLRAILWFKFTIKASCHLHDNCLKSVFAAPLQFFVANPTGRILNRFSRDMNIIDELLPYVFFDTIQSSLLCLSAFVLVFVAVPYTLLLVPPISYVFIKLRRKYVASSLEIKRTEAVLRSPIYANFSATLDGLITLRAYKLEAKMKNAFFRMIDDNGRALFSFMIINRWFGLRLDGICAGIVLILAVLACALKDTINVGLLGFALAYMMSVSALFQWTVRQSAEVESQMTSVERLCSYIDLTPEPYKYLSGNLSKLQSINYFRINAQEEQGEEKVFELDVDASPHFSYKKVTLRDLTATYRMDLDPVLKGLNVSIPFGSKVGVCGRTGSGKSSFLLALLRLNIITGGDVLLDDESLVSMPLEEARSRISLIPQEPHLFSGTLRFNLDPFSLHTDREIWAALDDAHIKEHVQKDPNGLMATVEEGGKNFSVGQRQLLSLARAILRRCPIVLMDEVSASIDYATDALIQSTIRKSPTLRNSTIFTIAHRLRTIADSDVIFVIDHGRLAEVGKPAELLERMGSRFRELVEESGELEDILHIAGGGAQI